MWCKNCLGKNCWYLEKNNEHPYWKQRATKKQKRMDRKQKLNMYVENIQKGVI